MRHLGSLLIAAAAIGGCGGSGDEGVTTAPKPAQGDEDVVFPSDCASGLEAEPTSIVVSCADRGITVEDIEWQSWGAEEAAGNGTAQVNDCKPDCVAGKLNSYDGAELKLSGIVECDGTQQYSKLELSIEGAAPPGRSGPTRERFPCPV